jgi:TRAP-type mannitol/chloroaromatic compound transport system permease large subunit
LFVKTERSGGLRRAGGRTCRLYFASAPCRHRLPTLVRIRHQYLFCLYVIVRTHLNPRLGPPLLKEERDFPLGRIIGMLLTSVLPISALIFFVLGSIVMGWAAPTETSAMGAAGALILSAVYRRLNLTTLKESIFEAIRTSSMVLFLLVGSSLFAAVFALLGGSKVIKSYVLGLNLSPTGFIWLTMLIILESLQAMTNKP